MIAACWILVGGLACWMRWWAGSRAGSGGPSRGDGSAPTCRACSPGWNARTAGHWPSRSGDGAPDGMQRLLHHADWDDDGVRDDVRDYVVEHLGAKDAVLIVDDTGFLKKGVRSAGVQRQYTGTAGRMENCQIGSVPGLRLRPRAGVDRPRALPARCPGRTTGNAAAQPGSTTRSRSRPRTRLAMAMLERAIDARRPVRVGHRGRGLRAGQAPAGVAGGATGGPRAGHQGQRHRDHPAAGADARADTLVAALPPAGVEAAVRSAPGAQASGSMTGPASRSAPCWENGFGHWLLARRSVSDPTEIAYYVCYGPRRATAARPGLDRRGHAGRIEECFQTAKNEAGLDHYQVRHYRAWYAHITLSMLALAGLAAIKTHAAKGEQTCAIAT